MKIHLGCGFRRLPGYVHIDPDETCKPDHVGDALNIPVDDDGVDLLYFCHGLEHVGKGRAKRALKEFRRVLKPGALLRLSMPDFATIAHLYLNEGVHLKRLGCINGGQDNDNDIHYEVYDFEHLACLLQRWYYDIRRWDPLVVHSHDYDDFSLARINGRLISLNVEATCK